MRQQGLVRYAHESHIDAPPEVVFAFHEAPGALARLVPPWERVEVVTPPSSLAPGTRVVFGDEDGGVYGFRISDGSVAWQTDLNGVWTAGPLASDAAVFFG